MLLSNRYLAFGGDSLGQTTEKYIMFSGQVELG